MACRPAGSSQEANPLDSAVNPIPALSACRLAHSCPLTHYAAARIMRGGGFSEARALVGAVCAITGTT